VDEVAEVLDVSNDNAYRKVHGEASISIEELSKLGAYFKISLDQALNLQKEGGTFTGKYITPENFNFEKYLEQQLNDLRFVASFKQKELTYVSKDIPFFYYFAFPELAAFKYFFWMKTLLQFPQFAHTSFSFDLLLQPLIDIGLKVFGAYNLIAGTEIMSIENINTTLRQIEYCKETYLFRSKEDLEVIFKKLHEMTDHLESMAEAGMKFIPGQKPGDQSAEYKLYVNDFFIGDNSLLAAIDGNKVSYLIHSHANYIMITNPYLQLIISILSRTSSKNPFLSVMLEKNTAPAFFISSIIASISAGMIRWRLLVNCNAMFHEA
jgi:hypothetical protein